MQVDSHLPLEPRSSPRRTAVVCWQPAADYESVCSQRVLTTIAPVGWKVENLLLLL